MVRRDVLNDVVLGSLKISVCDYEPVKDSCIIVLQGYVDTYNSVTFKNKIVKLIDAGYRHLIIDCAELKYISSTGVGSLIAVLKDLRALNGDLVLVKIESEVYQVIKILGFAKIIRNFNSLVEVNDFFCGNLSDSGEVKATTTGFSFPAIAVCPACMKKMKISHAGRFRCIQCKSIFGVTELGKVTLQEASLYAAG